jgi:fatty-acyl-CoA synthase
MLRVSMLKPSSRSRAARLSEVRERIAGLPEKVKVAAQLAQSSGLMWSTTLSGFRTMVRVLASGSQQPSHVYKIHAQNFPTRPAVIHRERSITFGELDHRIDRVAAGLKRRGIGRGAGVVLMMKNRPEFLELSAAAGRCGAAAVAVSWRSTPAELEYLVNHSGARGVAFDAELAHVVEQAKPKLPEVEHFFAVGDASAAKWATPFDALADTADHFVPDATAHEDAAVVIYTSGTTGKPKGAVRKFASDTMPAFMRFLIETPMRTDDVHLVTCPLYHSTAFGFMSLSHMLGSTVVLMDEFKPEAFLQLVERHEVSTTALVPTMLHRVLELGPEVLRKYDTRSLRAIFSGGAPLPGPLAIEVMDQFGDVLFNFYGATETGLVTLAKPADLRAAPGTIGKAIPGNEIRLVDDSGKDVPPGTVGELYVRNKMLVAGYHNDEEATRSSMLDGFFSVGDLARVDRDGRYFIEGRKRDMIISGGVNVYPAEVEGVLEAHPDIAEVAVVGVEDREWGERVRAFVVKRAGSSLDEGSLKTWTRERLAGPKVPRDFVFLDALPRNPTGKVLKRELREHQG